MVPSPEMQLRSAIKSLTDSVRPAIDATNKAAAEQVDLVIATLAMVRDRIPLLRRFARAELKDQIELASKVTPYLIEGGVAIEAIAILTQSALALLADPAGDATDLEHLSVEFGNAVACAIAELPPAGTSRLTKMMLETSAIHVRRMQAWNLPAGYDSNNDGSLAIEKLI